jgi:dethiobiotin synthetase
MSSGCLVVAGIGTDVGKTVVSAVLCRTLQADYWKPVASGTEDGPVDHQVMSSLLAGTDSKIHPCAYVFRKSLSPHIAAKLDGDEISLERIQVPQTDRPIIIELAGGLAVPLNDSSTNLDLLTVWSFPVVVVSRHYLGSINHTLLTLEALQNRDIPVAGIIFNGEELPDTERIIERLGKVPVWGRIPMLSRVTAQSVSQVRLQITQDATFGLSAQN